MCQYFAECWCVAAWKAPCSLSSRHSSPPTLFKSRVQTRASSSVSRTSFSTTSRPAPCTRKFWCFLVALERRSAALVVRRQHPYHQHGHDRDDGAVVGHAVGQHALIRFDRARWASPQDATAPIKCQHSPKSTPSQLNLSLFLASHPSFRADSRGNLRGSRRLALLR